MKALVQEKYHIGHIFKFNSSWRLMQESEKNQIKILAIVFNFINSK